MKKKLITAVLAVTMAVGMLTGCGSGTGTGKRKLLGKTCDLDEYERGSGYHSEICR